MKKVHKKVDEKRVAILVPGFGLAKERRMTQALFLMVLSCLAVSLVTAQNPTAVAPKHYKVNNRDILFDSKQDGSEIWAVRPDGSALRQLTHSSKNSLNAVPDWSSDGTKIIFASTQHAPSQSFDDYDLYVMNSDGSNLKRLTYGGGADPDWSPDGKRIAFVSNRDGNWKVYVMNADGSGIQRLTSDQITPSPKMEVTPSWSPDGRKIAFSSDRDGADLEMYVLDLGTSIPIKLTAGSWDARPAWSPDGRFIAFDSRREGNWDIYVMKADGSNVIRLTNDPKVDTAPAWSLDGRSIAFNSTRDARAGDPTDFEIYVMNADGSDPKRLTFNQKWDGHPDW